MMGAGTLTADPTTEETARVTAERTATQGIERRLWERALGEAKERLEGALGDAFAQMVASWEVAPVQGRMATPEAADQIFGPEVCDEILTNYTLRLPALRMARDGEVLPPSEYTRSASIGHQVVQDLVDPGRVLALHRDGSTIILQGVDRQHRPLRDLANDLSKALECGVQANVYITPPSAQGFDVHIDYHDVLVLQTHGSKQWGIWDPEVNVPLKRQSEDLRPPDPSVRPADHLITLVPGDLLYLPRGFPHFAATSSVDESSPSSIHVTLGFVTPKVHSLLEELIRGVATEHSALRKGLASPEKRADFTDSCPLTDGTILSDLANRVSTVEASLKRQSQRRQATDLTGAFSDAFSGELGHVADLEPCLHNLIGARADEAGSVTLECHDRDVSFAPDVLDVLAALLLRDGCPGPSEAALLTERGMEVASALVDSGLLARGDGRGRRRATP